MENKRILIVYYSRTGTTERIASEIAESLNCDIEKLYEIRRRDGILGYITAGRDARNKTLGLINQIENDPSDYDMIIIGTPIWASSISCAVRTYLVNGKEKFKNVALFTTSAGSGNDKLYNEVRKLAGKKAIPYMSLSAKEIKKGQYKNKINIFLEEIK